MSATLHSLPASTTMTPDQALISALQLNLTEVIVIGYDADGSLLIRSSAMSRRDALWMAEQLRAHALNPEMEA